MEIKNELTLSKIRDAAQKATIATRLSRGMKTHNITEEMLELAERAYINGALWAKDFNENNTTVLRISKNTVCDCELPTSSFELDNGTICCCECENPTVKQFSTT